MASHLCVSCRVNLSEMEILRLGSAKLKFEADIKRIAFTIHWKVSRTYPMVEKFSRSR